MSTPTCPADEPESADPDSLAADPEPEPETTPPGPPRKDGYQPL